MQMTMNNTQHERQRNALSSAYLRLLLLSLLRALRNRSLHLLLSRLEWSEDLGKEAGALGPLLLLLRRVSLGLLLRRLLSRGSSLSNRLAGFNRGGDGFLG